MAKHLYILKDEALAGSKKGDPYVFGIKTTGKGSDDDFYALNRQISLKHDLKWGEVSHLQKIFCKAEIWENFPAENLKFICAELKLGEENQRIDLLYLRDDGGLYICELKIGGTSLDAPGQLIRYIADLHNQPVNIEWVCDKRLKYLGSDKEQCIIVPSPEEGEDTSAQQSREFNREKMITFFSEKGIADRDVHLIKNEGIIVDEGFKSQVITTVRHLNEQCGFSIRLLRLDAFVAEDWSLEQPEFRVRIDVVEVQ